MLYVKRKARVSYLICLNAEGRKNLHSENSKTNSPFDTTAGAQTEVAVSYVHQRTHKHTHTHIHTCIVVDSLARSSLC